MMGESANADGVVPGHEDVVLSRLARMICGGLADPVRQDDDAEYFASGEELFWDLHFNDLVNDVVGLGLARGRGLAPFRDLMGEAFAGTYPIAMGYVTLAGHINNLALTEWMPESSRTAPKVQALAQLHARSLVLFEEVIDLTLAGYPSGASALSRTLHEVRVIAKFLHRFEARLSERYLVSHVVDVWQKKDDFAPSGPARSGRQWAALEREIDEKYEEVIAKYGPSMNIENGWAWPRFAVRQRGEALPRRIPFSRLEEQVRRPHDRVRYRVGSRQVHAGYLGNINTLRGPVSNEALLGPRPFGLKGPAVQAAWETQEIAESLLRACGRLTTGNAEIYYWLEALDQMSHVLRSLISDAQLKLDYVFGADDEDSLDQKDPDEPAQPRKRK